jgi:phosphatidate cytidylyltransferase
VEEGKGTQATGEPVTGRVRIAGVEAGVAAGLVSSTDAESRPDSESLELVSGFSAANEVASPLAALPAYELPDWTDPPTLQVPRVFLDLEQEAADRGGPPTPPRGGPVWRERQEDWADTDTVLAHLASAGPSVADYEESSADDPFAYDFLSLDDESSWITREEGPGTVRTSGRTPVVQPPAAKPAPPAPKPADPVAVVAALSISAPSAPLPVAHKTEAPLEAPRRRRHIARPGLAALVKRAPAQRASGTRTKADTASSAKAVPVPSDPEPETKPEATGLDRASVRSDQVIGTDADTRFPNTAPARPDPDTWTKSDAISPRKAVPRRSGPVSRPASQKSSSRNPIVATLTGVALAAILLLSFKAGPPAVLALVAVAVTVAAAELFNSLRLGGYRPATLLGLLGVPAIIVAAYFRGPAAILVGLVIFVVASMVWYLAGFTRRSPLANLSVTVFAFAWTGVLAAFAGLLVDPRIFPNRHGIAFMLGAVIAAVGYDIGGYAIGSRFGRHRLVPSVSPNKTWEGLIGGCAIAIAASAAVTSRIHPWHLSTAVWLGLIVAVVAPCGDLVESMIKRDLGVKDMGTLLPGHGGVFDRIDALLFVLPAAYYFVRLAHVG